MALPRLDTDAVTIPVFGICPVSYPRREVEDPLVCHPVRRAAVCHVRTSHGSIAPPLLETRDALSRLQHGEPRQ